MSEQEENRLVAERRRKLDELRGQGVPYPNDFRKNALADELHGSYGEWTNTRFEEEEVRVAVAGRMMAKRVMGKASFARLQDMSGGIQLFLTRDLIGEDVYRAFKGWDVGDIVAAEGVLFRTRTDELSIRVDTLRILTKSLRPLPEKYHGLTDQETRYRQRYVDLIMNEDSRRVFRIRGKMCAFIREYLDTRGFVEVETPIMQVIPGGANAKPFVTHHNALGIDMYLRIAPELYLKRLIVGGMERVYELNRSFRNEGLSTRHNPEFTMLEIYHAYTDCNDMMDLTEQMIRLMAECVLGETSISYQGENIDLGEPFRRLSMEDAIREQDPQLDAGKLRDADYLRGVLRQMDVDCGKEDGAGRLQEELFEQLVESTLRQPTFITQYPAEVSPLARLNDSDDFVTDRFELFIGGRELANGFSELNDPEEQARRFSAQAELKTRGDEEAMYYDADYIRALEFGMPPTSGLGVGIDRLMMLFTDAPTIRDVVLFPHMRPESEPEPGDDK
jgi:lysyl-tRNA synthetase class 2